MRTTDTAATDAPATSDSTADASTAATPGSGPRALHPALFLPFGALFGFVLSRAGATSYDYYAGLFLFSDLQLLWVIAAGAATGAVGIGIMKKLKTRAMLTGEPISFTGKPYQKQLIPGALLLGLGWGLAGACPGTVLAMLGEGKLNALFTIGGILLGTWIYGLFAGDGAASKR